MAERANFTSAISHKGKSELLWPKNIPYMLRTASHTADTFERAIQIKTALT